MERVPGAFFEQETVALARALLGKQLVTSRRGVVTAGTIVEVEAYLGSGDPACHAARGKTPRNAIMFAAPGHCYVYLIYGMYYCVNVVSDPEGVGSAVLVRAVEPTVGLGTMARRRSAGRVPQRNLARGPGRLCQALAIDRSFSGEHFDTSSKIWIAGDARRVPSSHIETTGRIGISLGSELPLRFSIAGSPWVSGVRSQAHSAR
jgi:DNA-3-methyladenine glycosylase